MKKNITEKESQMRNIVAIVLLLTALLVIENPFIKILLAIISAVLAITSFLHVCPMRTFLKKGNEDNKMNNHDEIENTEETKQEEPANDEDEEKNENKEKEGEIEEESSDTQDNSSDSDDTDDE